MSERLPSDRPGASSLHGDRGELEVTVSTVRLEESFAAVRRHVRLVVGVVWATVAAAGVVAYVTGPAYRAVPGICLSDQRRALPGRVVLDPQRAGGLFSDLVVSRGRMITRRAGSVSV